MFISLCNFPVKLDSHRFAAGLFSDFLCNSSDRVTYGRPVILLMSGLELKAVMSAAFLVFCPICYVHVKALCIAGNLIQLKV